MACLGVVTLLGILSPGALPLLLIFGSSHFPTHVASLLAQCWSGYPCSQPLPALSVAWLTQLCLPGWHSHGQTLKSWTLGCRHRTSTLHSAYRPLTGTNLTAAAWIKMISSTSEGLGPGRTQPPLTCDGPKGACSRAASSRSRRPPLASGSRACRGELLSQSGRERGQQDAWGRQSWLMLGKLGLH